MQSIWQLIWQLIQYAQRLYWVDALLWLCIAGFPILPGVLIREFFDSLTDQSRLDSSPWVWIGLLLATGLARVVAIFIGRITKTQHRFLISALVRHNLLLELLKRPGAELTTRSASGQNSSVGEILSYFRDDALQIEDTVVGTNEILAEAVFAVVSMALMLSVNARMTLLVFLPLCLITALVRRAEQRLKRYHRASRQATQQVTGLLGEMFAAVQAVKVAGAENQMLENLKERCDRRRHLMIHDHVFSATLNASFENIVSLGTGLILLLAAQSLGPQGNLTIGDFALFVYYLSFVTYFFSFLGSFLAITQQSEVSFERMANLASIDEPGAFPHPLTYPHSLPLKPILGLEPDLPAIPVPPATETLQQLRVEGLTYRYPSSDNGITNISFALTRGSLTVITGRVGAGKTTLLRVLLGLLPMRSGMLFWNGQSIQDPANFWVPPRAAYTPQTPKLFSTSLRKNLLLGLDGSVSPERLEKAIATAVLDQDIATLPNGLDTRIGTGGVRLSGGQKQRAAAARMLLRQPELLVFDDLSSALDIKTEQRLWEQLFERRQSGKSQRSISTCLVVSHRPFVIARADQVIYLEAGKVISQLNSRGAKA